jgi:hypothetical protein
VAKRFPSARLWPFLWALAALVPVVYLWGFQVDDALVTARVAHQVATGHGYRFNAGGPIVDAVTSLGWAFLLVPFATGSVLGAFGAAKWLGALSWTAAAAWLGHQATAQARTRPVGPLCLTLVVQAPLAAWAVSGMETGVVTALGTLALTESRWALLAAGLAAGWRPELLPWAATLTAGSALVRARRPGPAVWALFLVALPSALVGAARLWVFGTVAPLSVMAKPSDVAHGLYYALGALVHTGLPLLVLAPWAWRRLSGHHLGILVAFVVHLVAVVLVGGDWMALYRLTVPVLPGLVLVGAALVERAAPWASIVRLVLACGFSTRLMVAQGPRARIVGQERAQVMQELGPALASARSVAALDVGWVGAVTDARVVDLAGITDPTVAVLPGGHTSKRIPDSFLRVRQVDRVVLLLGPGAPREEPWPDGALRVVEVLALRQAREIGFAVAASAPLGRTGRYVVLRLTSDR